MIIDWQTVVNNLRRVMPLERVARDLGACPVHLRRLARGEVREPKFTVGLKLLDMHYDQCRDRHNSIIW